MCTAPERDFLSVLHCGFFVEIRHCRGRNSAFYVISSCILEEIFRIFGKLLQNQPIVCHCISNAVQISGMASLFIFVRFISKVECT